MNRAWLWLVLVLIGSAAGVWLGMLVSDSMLG